MKQHDVHVFVFDGLADWEVGYASPVSTRPSSRSTPAATASRPFPYNSSPS